ncbi:MAG: hypothetical protein AB7P37_03365 [Ramlibacter sp.]
MNPHAITTWLCAAIVALLLAALPGWMDQPTPTYTSFGYTPATLEDGQAELLDAQARQACAATHGINGGYIALPDGGIQCTNKHGRQVRSVITVLSHQPDHHHTTGGIKP